ncbi:MAG: protein kinase [Sulfuricaulis sp.]|nr:protein kinase [Sulfuricaulis sp.]
MTLFLDTGFSERGDRRDHGSCLVTVPNTGKDDAQGALLALAMDVVNRTDHAPFSQGAVQSLGESYYSAPKDWGLKRAINESFQAVNQALCSGAKRGRAVSLTALVLRRRHWAIGHAGTNRVWLLRDNELKLLTHDHVAPSVGRLSRVNNACGMNKSLAIDLSVGELREGDVFALTAGGVHNFIDSATIMGCLLADVPAQDMTENLRQRALAAGAKDAVYACVARMGKLPRERLIDREEDERRLPVVAPPALGATVDSFQILHLLHTGSHYRLYKAMDNESGKTVALKFPNPKYARDPSFAERFLHEEWVGKRLNCAHLLPVLSPRPGRRTALYSVLAYQHGKNLSARMQRKGNLSVRETLFHGRQILEAIGELHAQGVVHGDLRPKNILLDKKNKRLLLLSAGTVHTTPPGSHKKISTASDGNRSYLAPELFEGKPASTASDIYAVGVMLYRFLTGKFPYGKVEPNRRDWGEFISPTRYRADIPKWLIAVLQRACALDPAERYPSAADFAQPLAEDRKPNTVRKKTTLTTARHIQKPWELYAAVALVAGLLVYMALMLI